MDHVTFVSCAYEVLYELGREASWPAVLLRQQSSPDREVIYYRATSVVYSHLLQQLVCQKTDLARDQAAWHKVHTKFQRRQQQLPTLDPGKQLEARQYLEATGLSLQQQQNELTSAAECLREAEETLAMLALKENLQVVPPPLPSLPAWQRKPSPLALPPSCVLCGALCGHHWQCQLLIEQCAQSVRSQQIQGSGLVTVFAADHPGHKQWAAVLARVQAEVETNHARGHSEVREAA
jgi:hypothetical protein